MDANGDLRRRGTLPLGLRGAKKKGERITDAERFDEALRQIVGKRLTYAELTGKEGASAPF